MKKIREKLQWLTRNTIELTLILTIATVMGFIFNNTTGLALLSCNVTTVLYILHKDYTLWLHKELVKVYKQATRLQDELVQVYKDSLTLSKFPKDETS